MKKANHIAAAVAAALGMTSPAAALTGSAKPSARVVTVDVSKATVLLNRSFNFSVGADYAGTTRRPENLAQLKTAVAELGFRYIRLHDIFHDKLGTVRVVDGRTVYDWTEIDRMYDAFLATGIKPFIELGFTPGAMKTSDQTIFYWNGNTSHPKPEAWSRLVDAFVRHLRSRYGEQEVRSWFFEVWNEPNLAAFWEKADQNAYSSSTKTPTAPSRRSIRSCAWAALRQRALPGFPNCSPTPGRAASAWISSPPTPTASTAGSSTRKARTTTSCREAPTPSSATCGGCASRSKPRARRGCHCTSPSGARATTRATRSTIPTSAPPIYSAS